MFFDEAVIDRPEVPPGWDMSDLGDRDGLGWELLQAAPDATVVVDREGIIRFANRRIRDVFGYQPGELVGRPVEVLIPDRLAGDHVSLRTGYTGHPRARPMGSGLEFAARRQDGSEFPVDVSLSPLMTDQGLFVLAAVRDATDRKRFEQELARLALHDPLTGLPNRQLLTDRLRLALTRHGRHGGGLAVLYADLDRFKWVNDSLGHEKGDLLLIEVGCRLARSVREGDTVSRFGGDEFVIVADDIGGQDEAEQLADRCIEAVASPVSVDDTEISQTASIGIALCLAGQRCEADALIHHADFAMYRAKEQGRARREVFGDATRRATTDPLEEDRRLRRAIEAGEIVCFYQPEIDLDSSDVVAMEALARWDDPRRGMLTPDRFIPFAEESGLILPLGSAVLQAACRQGLAWRGAGGDWTVAINLSARQLLGRGLIDDVGAALACSGLPASSLVLEITETVLLHDLPAAATALGALKDLGVRIAVDDFGTGYASLTYLKGLPVDEVKIDRTFVAGLAHDPRDRVIVAAIIDMAHAFALTTTAEGVEHPEQLQILHDLGAERAQGFLWTPPLSDRDIAAWIAGRPTPPIPISQAKAKSVLVIDDDPALRRLIQAQLSDHGLRILEAADGRAGVAMAARHRPNVVLLDLALPGMGGLEAIPLIRSIAPDSQILVLSDHDAADMAETAIALGAHAYLNKGSNITRLDQIIEKSLAG